MPKIRGCDSCTACCDGWLRITEEATKGKCSASLNKPCKFSTGSGCSDYENRPDNPCKIFRCAWLNQKGFSPDWMRPDLSKAIIVRNIREWKGIPMDVAYAVGEKVPEHILKWLKTHADLHSRILLYSENIMDKDSCKYFVHSNTPHNAEIIQSISLGNKLF